MRARWGKKKLTRMWRKYGFGRLYWRNSHRRWRSFFESDDVAVAKEGAGKMHFKTFEAIQDAIQIYMIENNVGEK